MSTDGIRIEEAVIPARPGDPGWDDFVAASEIDDAIELAVSGTRDSLMAPEEKLPHWNDPSDETIRLLARRDGALVGLGSLDRQRASTETAWIGVAVPAEHRGQGIGRLLADEVERRAAADGATKLIVYAAAADRPGPRIDSPTGHGSMPADDPGVRMLVARGYRLEQVERGSRLPLPVDPALLERLREEAEPRSAGYEVLTWHGVTPPELREGMARLLERMSTDAPSAGLEEPEEHWSEERVREWDERMSATVPLVTSAARHVESGRLAGYTRLSASTSGSAARQWDTIVRAEDRGHRLGMLLKVVNLQAFAARHPGHPSVLTWNADENRYMLSVNEAIGFAPLSYEGAWRKDV